MRLLNDEELIFLNATTPWNKGELWTTIPDSVTVFYYYRLPRPKSTIFCISLFFYKTIMYRWFQIVIKLHFTFWNISIKIVSNTNLFVCIFSLYFIHAELRGMRLVLYEVLETNVSFALASTCSCYACNFVLNYLKSENCREHKTLLSDFQFSMTHNKKAEIHVHVGWPAAMPEIHGVLVQSSPVCNPTVFNRIQLFESKDHECGFVCSHNLCVGGGGWNKEN